MGLLIAMSVFSYRLYYRGLAQTSVSSASVIETLGSVITWAVAAAFFHQGLGRIQTAGVCLILSTLLVSVQGLRRVAQRVAVPPVDILAAEAARTE